MSDTRPEREPDELIRIVVKLSRGELLSQQLIENLLREDLRPVEEANMTMPFSVLVSSLTRPVMSAAAPPPRVTMRVRSMPRPAWQASMNITTFPGMPADGEAVIVRTDRLRVTSALRRTHAHGSTSTATVMV